MIYLVNHLPPSSGNDSLLMNRISVQQVVDNSNSGLLSSIKSWAGPLAMDASEYGVNLQARWHRLVL
jgi:hypothetical protein